MRALLEKLKPIGLWGLIIVVSTVPVSAQSIAVSPDNPNIQYHGRWNLDNPTKPWVYWPGSMLVVTFEGMGVTIDIEVERGTEQFRVVLDGVPEAERRYITGRDTLVLASDVSAGAHTVHLMKETYYAGKTVVHGLSVEGEGLHAPPPRPALRIAFFGDSNMAGASNYSEKNEGDMGTYYAFPAMVARMLGAEMHLQAVGGAKLADNEDNSVQSFIFSEDYDNQDSAYRSGFDPQIIVVSAGANDVGAGKPTIKKRYKAVLADLRKVYGEEPHIVLFNAYGWDINEPALYTQEVVNEVGGNLSAKVYPWLWERWHGSQWDQSGEAYQLVEHLARINPIWTSKYPNAIIDGFGRNFDVANGSFEHVAPFGGFGWRYHEDGVERIYDPNGAADGDYYIRLEAGEEIHQPIDATGDMVPGGTTNDQRYYVQARIRAVSGTATAQLDANFEGQQIYNRANPITHAIPVDATWRTYTTSFTAPNGTWKTFLILRASEGIVDFDQVLMSNHPFPPEGR